MKRTPRCPVCRRTVTDPGHAPFCSARCRDIDMGKWLAGEYRVPAEEPAPSRPPTPENGYAPD